MIQQAMKYWYMLQQEWILKTLFQMKEANHKDYILLYDSIYLKFSA